MSSNMVSRYIWWVGAFVAILAILSTWAIVRHQGKNAYIVLVWLGAIFIVLFYVNEYKKRVKC